MPVNLVQFQFNSIQINSLVQFSTIKVKLFDDNGKLSSFFKDWERRTFR
jgi:hypothetical protein